jgi:hypothetical protein
MLQVHFKKKSVINKYTWKNYEAKSLKNKMLKDEIKKIKSQKNLK